MVPLDRMTSSFAPCGRFDGVLAGFIAAAPSKPARMRRLIS